MPSSQRSAAIWCASRASPSMMGTIGCSPGRMREARLGHGAAEPAGVGREPVAARGRLRQQLEAGERRRRPARAAGCSRRGRAASAGAGARRSRAGLAVKPPLAPPSALPSVEVMMSTRPATPQCSGVPRPVGPKKPVAWLSSTITSASYRSARSQISASGATSPSMEKTPSVAIRRVRAAARLLEDALEIGHVARARSAGAGPGRGGCRR